MTAPQSGTDTPREAPPGLVDIHGVFWYRMLIDGVGRVPTFVFFTAVPIGVALAFLLLRGVRRAIASNLEAVLGPCGFWERQRRVVKTLWNYAWCLGERSEDLAKRRLVTPTVIDDEHWQSAIASSRGFVLVTAHIGHWEVASAYPSDLHGRKIHVVRQAEKESAAQEYFQQKLKTRGRDGYTVHFTKNEASLGPKLLMALRDGDIVALQGDRPARGGRSIETTLFGRPFHIPVGPAVIARTASATLLPVFVYRAGRSRSRLVFKAPIELERTGDRDADLQRIADTIVSEVEAAIREEPFQWFCFEELWPKR